MEPTKELAMLGDYLMTVGIFTVILLCAYLYSSINGRFIDRQAEERSHSFQATPIDVSNINPTVQRVRQDPASELHRRPHQTSRRATLVSNARTLVTNLAFFRHHNEENAKNVN